MRSIVLSLLGLFYFLFFGSNALEYYNRWTVQIDGHSGEAERLARKYGFVIQGKVGTCINWYGNFQYYGFYFSFSSVRFRPSSNVEFHTCRT